MKPEPHDFDAAPSDLLRISADNVGAHGRMPHMLTNSHSALITCIYWKSL